MDEIKYIYYMFKSKEGRVEFHRLDTYTGYKSHYDIENNCWYGANRSFYKLEFEDGNSRKQLTYMSFLSQSDIVEEIFKLSMLEELKK